MFSSKHALKVHLKAHAAAVKSHFEAKTHVVARHNKDHSYDNTVGKSGVIDEFPCRLCDRYIYIYAIYYYYYNAFITLHTSGLKTCSEALTRHSVHNKVNIKISIYAQQLRTLINS